MKMTYFTIKAGSPSPFWLSHLYHLRWFTFTIKMVHQSRSGAPEFFFTHFFQLLNNNYNLQT
jgi:hypothetical protein